MKRKKICSIMMILSLGILSSTTSVLAEGNNENFSSDKSIINVLDGPSAERSVDIFAEKHNIMGKEEVSKEAFKKYFKKMSDEKGYIYKLNCTIDEFVDIAYEEASIEEVRGDIVIAQAIWETAHFQYGGIVDKDDNNYAGIGAVGTAGVKERFKTPRLGIRAQVQHLKAYASTDSLVLDLVDPRFKYVTRGSAVSVEELSGKWAVPGYDTKTYKSLAEAAKNNGAYGQRIYNLVKAAKAYNTIEDNNQNSETVTKTGKVNVSTSLNVRKGPGTSYSIIDKLYNGKQVSIVGEENGFYKVKYDGKEGYVSKNYITVLSSSSNGNSQVTYKTGVTTNTSASLNVRKGPGTNYSIIGALKPKSQVIIIDKGSTWTKIAYYVNGTKIEGYISSAYIKIN